jgi:hypothetical protein
MLIGELPSCQTVILSLTLCFRVEWAVAEAIWDMTTEVQALSYRSRSFGLSSFPEVTVSKFYRRYEIKA